MIDSDRVLKHIDMLIERRFATCDPDEMYDLVQRIFSGCRPCSLCKNAPTDDGRSMCVDCLAQRRKYKKSYLQRGGTNSKTAAAGAAVGAAVGA